MRRFCRDPRAGRRWATGRTTHCTGSSGLVTAGYSNPCTAGCMLQFVSMLQTAVDRWTWSMNGCLAVLLLCLSVPGAVINQTAVSGSGV